MNANRRIVNYMNNDSDTLHKAMKDTSRLLDNSSWTPNEEACDAERQALVDDAMDDLFRPLDNAIANLKAIVEDGK